jgi:hypothetical protein
MKSEQLYQELKLLAEKLGVQVSEQNFRNTGIRVKSGACLVKDVAHCIIDKHLRVNQKVEILAECLSVMPHESVYVVPAVREYLDQFKPHQNAMAPEASSGKSNSE